jgi:hypothetical protein
MPAARLWKTMEPERSDAILCPPRSNHPGNLLGFSFFFYSRTRLLLFFLAELGFSCDGSREGGAPIYRFKRCKGTKSLKLT